MPIIQYGKCPKCGNVFPNPLAAMLGRTGARVIQYGTRVQCPRCLDLVPFPDTDIWNTETEDGWRVYPKQGDAVSWIERIGTLKRAVESAQSTQELKDIADNPEFAWAKPFLDRVYALIERMFPEKRHSHILVLVALLTLALNKCEQEGKGPPQTVVINDQDIISTINNITVTAPAPQGAPPVETGRMLRPNTSDRVPLTERSPRTKKGRKRNH